MLVCGVPLLVGEVAFIDRRNDGPVMSHRTVLNSPQAEAKRLDRHRGNPDRCEQVAIAAAHHDVATEPVASHPQGGGLDKEGYGRRNDNVSMTTVTSLRGPASVSPVHIHASTVLPRRS